MFMFKPPPMPPHPLRRDGTLKSPQELAREQQMRAFEQEDKWFMAFMIVIMAIMVMALVGLLGAALFLKFGLKGPLGALVFVGLAAVAVAEVHKRI